MPFVTLRHKDWMGGEVSMDIDGDSTIIQLRDPNPVRGYMVVDLHSGEVVGRSYTSMRAAQEAVAQLKDKRRT